MKASGDYLSDVKTVFLFGAGTSRHMRLGDGPPETTVPADADFFRKAKDIRSWCKEEQLARIGKDALDYVLRSLAQHGIRKEQLIPEDDKAAPDVSMETAFCRLEMVRMLRRSTGRTSASRGWKHSVEAFRDLIAIVMAAGQRADQDELDAGYDGFVRRMCRARRPKEWAVLTLNYELGIEYAANRYLWDGGFPQTRHMFERDPTERKQGHLYHYELPGRGQPDPKIGEAIPLLKLHGSCNWSICPICREDMTWLWAREDDSGFMIDRLVSDGVNRELCRANKRHPKQDIPCVTHIVPPTWNKWMADEATVHIWNAAYTLLKRCKQLFIIGTSLPDTDIHLRQMIQGALSSRSVRDRPTLYIVNKIDCEHCRQHYLERAKQAIGIHIDDNADHCCWGGFERPDTIEWIVDRARR